MTDIVLISIPETTISNIVEQAVIRVFTQFQKNEFSDFPELLTRKQAGKMVGVTLTTIDRYANDGILKKHRNGKLIRFKKSEVLEAFKTFQKWQRV